MWEEYRKDCLAKDTKPEVVFDVRCAFFSGIIAYLGTVDKLLRSGAPQSVINTVFDMYGEQVEKEIRAFRDELKNLFKEQSSRN